MKCPKCSKGKIIKVESPDAQNGCLICTHCLEEFDDTELKTDVIQNIANLIIAEARKVEGDDIGRATYHIHLLVRAKVLERINEIRRAERPCVKSKKNPQSQPQGLEGTKIDDGSHRMSDGFHESEFNRDNYR